MVTSSFEKHGFHALPELLQSLCPVLRSLPRPDVYVLNVVASQKVLHLVPSLALVDVGYVLLPALELVG